MTFQITEEGRIEKRVFSADEVLDSIMRQGVKFVDLQFTDVPGRLRHVTLPSEMMNPEMFSAGVAKLDGSSVKGFVDIHESDMLLVPDPSTFGVIPWIGEGIKTSRMICDVNAGYGAGRFSRDPRSVAQRAEERIRAEGFTESMWGPEIEFFVFDSATWEANNPFASGFRITSKESANEARGTNFPIRFKDGYYPAEPVDTLSEYRSECVAALREGFGILSNAHHHEVATAGQCEIDIYRDELVTMADSAMTYKYVVKNTARKRGKVVTVMPKPLFQDNGSGMHTHQSLWKAGKNIFYDKKGYGLISETARYYIGGLIKHAHALCAFIAPTTNSYRRLVPGYEAPINLVYSARNRSACVRIPMYSTSEKAKRLEFRTPDPSCNPYFAFPAMLMAGLDGIRNKIEPPKPIDKNLYELEPEEAAKVKSMPGSLDQALDALEKDHDFLLRGDVFTKDVIETWLEYKRKTELDAIRLRPHPWEFALYFDI